MAQDGPLPPLALSDIIRSVSPSPAPRTDLPASGSAVFADYGNTEPLTAAEIARMRQRIVEMGVVSSPGEGTSEAATSRERELAEMVIRLTEAASLGTAQLDRQAETISDLTAQCDYLLREAEAEKERWEAEKDSWSRTAEALLSHWKRFDNSSHDQDSERINVMLEFDNKALRDKLLETRARLHKLELELAKLRPVLLMEPFHLATNGSGSISLTQLATYLQSMPYPSLPNQHVGKLKLKKRKESRSQVLSATTGEEQDMNNGRISESERDKRSSGQNTVAQNTMGSNTPLSTPMSGGNMSAVTSPFSPAKLSTTSHTSGTSASPYSRSIVTETITEVPTPMPPRKQRSKARRHLPGTTLTSDARAEHLLLAARKIGRERVSAMTGYLKSRQAEELQKKEIAERGTRESEAVGERPSSALYHWRAGPNPTQSTSFAAASPRTPKRGIGNFVTATFSSGSDVEDKFTKASRLGSQTSPQTLNPALLLMDISRTPARGGHSMPAPSPYSSVSGDTMHTLGTNPVTPRHSDLRFDPRHSGPSSTQSTPLASLLDAARMMDKDGRRNDPTGKRMDSAAQDPPESPAPKRRKIALPSMTPTSARLMEQRDATIDISNACATGSGQGLGRVRSALDVLADQAAAFSSPDHHQAENTTDTSRTEIGRDSFAGEFNVDDEDDGEADRPPNRATGAGKGKAKTRTKDAGRDKETAVLSSTTLLRRSRTRGGQKKSAMGSTTGPDQAGSSIPRMISPPRSRRMDVMDVIDANIHPSARTLSEAVTHSHPALRHISWNDQVTDRVSEAVSRQGGNIRLNSRLQASASENDDAHADLRIASGQESGDDDDDDLPRGVQPDRNFGRDHSAVQTVREATVGRVRSEGRNNVNKDIPHNAADADAIQLVVDSVKGTDQIDAAIQRINPQPMEEIVHNHEGRDRRNVVEQRADDPASPPLIPDSDWQNSRSDVVQHKTSLSNGANRKDEAPYPDLVLHSAEQHQRPSPTAHDPPDSDLTVAQRSRSSPRDLQDDEHDEQDTDAEGEDDADGEPDPDIEDATRAEDTIRSTSLPPIDATLSPSNAVRPMPTQFSAS